MARKYPQLNHREGSHDPWPAIDPERRFQIGERHWYALRLVEGLAETKYDQIIDVGCGDGIIIGLLVSHGYPNLYGIDHSEEGIRRTQDTYPFVSTMIADLTEGDVLWPHHGSNKYAWHGAICTEVLEHLPRDEDVPKLMMKIYDALLQGGWCIISIPDDNICVIDDDHRRLFSPGDEVTILEDSGFTNVEPFVYHYSDQYPRPWMYAYGFKPKEHDEEVPSSDGGS